MKSKLFKFKVDWLKEASFYLMYVAGLMSIGYNAVMHDFAHCLSSLSFVLAAYGWMVEHRLFKNAMSACDSISNANNELIITNKSLNDEYKQEVSIVQGLISENKELKLKLKNAKMENSRLRKKGGNKNE